jgi:hypothetical protein
MSKSQDPMGGAFAPLPENKEIDYEDDSVVNKIQEHLQQFGGAKDDNLTPPIPKAGGTEEPESTPESKLEPELEPADEELDSESDSEPAAGNKGKPPIPDNHYRALLHQEWTPEMISKFYEKDAEFLLKQAEKAYKDVNSLSNQFAELGRARIESESKLKQTQPQIQPLQAGQVQQQGLDAARLEKLREQYENDPFGVTVELLKTLGQPQTQPVVQQTSVPVASREQFQDDLALTQHLIQFWGGEGMKPYEEFYGPMFDENGQPYLTTDHLTPGQFANRRQVLIKADQIIAGGAMLKEAIPVQQALSMAHLVVSAPATKQILRNELTSAVKKKAKGVTLRPSQRKAAPASKGSGQKSESELEKTTEERMRRYREGKPLI